jgi:phosphate transport system substrate-binding protein
VVLKVASTPFSIGYVELTYAIRRRTNFGAVLNRSGRYIKADLPSLSAAAALPANAGIPPSILNSPQPDAYPIATFTWFLIPDSLDVAKRKAASALLNWVLTSGQRQCSSLAYAPLPKEVVQKELREVAALQ